MINKLGDLKERCTRASHIMSTQYPFSFPYLYNLVRESEVRQRMTNGFRRDGEGKRKACGSSFPYMMIHNGFNDSALAYCDSCGRTVLLSLWRAPAAVTLSFGPIPANAESRLAPCACGGRFRSHSVPRCPACRAPLDADAAASYLEANAPETQKGWRWQRSWQGLYCIAVAEPPLHDTWLLT